MKKILLATAAIATLGIATPALADGDNMSTDTTVFTINANNPAKCNLTAGQTNLTLANNRISDNDGFALATVSQDVATALTNAGVYAWCTGASNTLQMYRTALVNGDGAQTTDGFNKSVIYDVTMAVSGATRSDGFSPLEGTSDGQGNGIGLGLGGGITLSHFGPSGVGSAVTFAAESNSNASNIGNAGAAGPRTAFPSDPNRLVAGAYTSTLTIELTPGV